MVALGHVQLIRERVIDVDRVETWQHDLEGLFEGLASAGTEMIVDDVACGFSDASERVLPDELFGHADDDCCLRFGHRLRAEAVGDL